MNLDDADPVTPKKQEQKKNNKLSRKEKKALKAAEKSAAAKSKPSKKSATPAPKATPKANDNAKAKPEATKAAPQKIEEVNAELQPAPVPTIPPPKYTLWEKISPPARRKRQITNMETGFREVLGLVQSMRENQEVLMESFKKLPEAVESVKKLADHSAQQSELLQAMNNGSADGGKFNETLASMDKTTQLLLERSQRSEERLYGMLRRAQNRIALMTFLVLLLFIGSVLGVFIQFPDETKSFFAGDGFKKPATESEEVVPESEIQEAVLPTATPEILPEPTPAAPVPTPEPAAAPAPTATPEPTPLPEPTATPEPTAVPKPTASPEPALETDAATEMIPDIPVADTPSDVTAPTGETEEIQN
jgi:hypothetical protein